MITKPGMYDGVPFDEYTAIPALNNSRLSLMKQSPAHYLSGGGKLKTDSLTVGELAHCGLLEPLHLATRYAVLPEFHRDAENVTAKGAATQSKNTTYYRDKVAEFEAANADRTIVDADTYDRVTRIVDGALACPEAGQLCRAEGRTEVTIVWEDRATGLLCKARIDKLIRLKQKRWLVMDLKTTSDLPQFSKSIARYGYHRQAAHYCVGLETLTGEPAAFHIVAVESAEPHCAQAAPVGRQAMEQGARERLQLLERVAECERTGEWPGPASPDEWRLPDWAIEHEPAELVVGGQTMRV